MVIINRNVWRQRMTSLIRECLQLRMINAVETSFTFSKFLPLFILLSVYMPSCRSRGLITDKVVGEVLWRSGKGSNNELDVADLSRISQYNIINILMQSHSVQTLFIIQIKSNVFVLVDNFSGFRAVWALSMLSV